VAPPLRALSWRQREWHALSRRQSEWRALSWIGEVGTCAILGGEFRSVHQKFSCRFTCTLYTWCLRMGWRAWLKDAWNSRTSLRLGNGWPISWAWCLLTERFGPFYFLSKHILKLLPTCFWALEMSFASSSSSAFSHLEMTFRRLGII